jgi:hypothetical protein
MSILVGAWLPVAVVVGALLGAAGCSYPVRSDQVDVRFLKSGAQVEAVVFTDPITGTRCYRSYGALWCEGKR